MALPIPPAQLKQWLIEERLIEPEKFEIYAEEAERKNQNLTDVLISEKIVDEGYLGRFIAKFLGVEIAELSRRGIDEGALKLLPEDISRERQAVVFAQEPDGTLNVAMTDPGDLANIEYLSKRLGKKIRSFLATQDDLSRAFSIYGSKQTTSFKQIIEDNIKESLKNKDKSEAEAAADLPIVSLVDNFLSYAISLRASDIHIERLEETTLIRYRIDGVLQEILRIPKDVHPAIVARLKLLSGLKIDEHRVPQDGRFRSRKQSQTIDLRVSVMPTSFGEKVVMRLLESTQKPLSLDELGMLDETVEVVKRNLKKSYGMILSCGPTGSGKTTTLYAIMNILNKPGVNISSVEDPIEYNIRYVNQSQINPDAGITFASGLRSMLRQDPDIIMVGEVRDPETANISVQASLTGHLLLSSLHTNDAPTAIPRLIDLKIPPFLVSSTLTLIIAQRLVRRICKSCIVSFKTTEEIRHIIMTQLDESPLIQDGKHIPKTLFKGSGCNSCGGTGYRGRIGIYEVLEIDDSVRGYIGSPDFSLSGLRDKMKEKNVRGMFEDGLIKAELALTTIEEVLRVIRE